MISYIVLSVLGLLLIVADQVTKALIAANLPYQHGGTVVIENFFEIVHWHNTGGAWGTLSGLTWLLTVFSVLCALILLYFYIAAKPVFLRLSLVLIIAGAAGNLIDRIVRGYVIDFLYFGNLFGYSFPAFNVADICITSGCIGVLIYVLFLSRKYEAFRTGTFAARFFSEKSDGKSKKIAAGDPAGSLPVAEEQENEIPVNDTVRRDGEDAGESAE